MPKFKLSYLRNLSLEIQISEAIVKHVKCSKTVKQLTLYNYILCKSLASYLLVRIIILSAVMLKVLYHLMDK